MLFTVPRQADMSNFSFQEAIRTDIETLLPLMQAYYQEDRLEVSSEHTRRAREQFFSSQDLNAHDLGRLWILHYRGKPDGYLALTWNYSFEYGGRVAEVDELYVAPQFRNRGLAQAALSFAETTCRALAVKALSLEALPKNESARRFYLRFGFHKVERNFLLKRF